MQKKHKESGASSRSSFFSKGKEAFFPSNDSGQKIQRKAEVDSTNHYTGNFLFTPGVDGLDAAFFFKVKRKVARSTLDDAAIKELRNDAITANGTISHAQLLLMAAMRDTRNTALMNAYSRGSLSIPMSQISKADEDYVINFGRETNPVDSTPYALRVLAATLGLSNEKVSDITAEYETRATDQIRQYAGKQFSYLADQLIIEAQDVPAIPYDDVINAMLNAAADSTPGDRIMAGIVYVIARRAGHPMAPKILSGEIMVDALVPSAYTRVVGAGDAAYQVSTDEDKLKADTIYVQTTLDIFDVSDRALVIHELTHAADDFGTTGTKQLDSLTIETHAYKEQGRYLMDQILSLPVTGRVGYLNSSAKYTKSSPLYYWSMVAAAKDDTAKYESVLVDINTHAPMSQTAAGVKSDLSTSAANLDTRVRTELLAYKDSRGKKIYQAGNTRVDGPAGHFFNP